MFSFPQIDPETTGRVTSLPVPLDKYLGASFDEGQNDSAFNSVMRMSELHLDNVDPTSPMLDAQTATQKYGVGDLKFDEPIREAAAATMNERKKSEMDRQFYLSNGSSRGRFLPGMAASMLGGVSNPLDLGLMFVPFVGEERLAARVAESGGGAIRQAIARGLITQERIAALKIPVPKLVGHVLQGTLNQSLFEIPNLAASMQDKADYTVGDAARNIIGGGIFAGGIHAAGKLWGKLSNGTRDIMNRQAVNQFLRDEDIRVDNYVNVDEHAIQQNVKFDEDAARQRALSSIDDDKLKQSIFETYHEHPTQAAVMLEDGTVHVGAFHGDAWGHVSKEDFDRVGRGEMAATEGFVTDTGRFVSRDEAAQLMGIHEYLTSEAMHGTSDESFLSEQESSIYHHYLEEGAPKSKAWNEAMKYRYQNQHNFFFDRPDIQEKLNAERERQVNAFVEKERQNYDPKTELTKQAHAEIQKQQQAGRTLTQETIDKYLQPEKFTETSSTIIGKDVENLKKNLEIQDNAGPQIEGFGNYTGDIDRPMVTIKVGKKPLIFYRSSKGSSGKTAGEWYPMFGFGPGDWMIKGKTADMKLGYGFSEIKVIQDSLNKQFASMSVKDVIKSLTTKYGEPSGGRQLAAKTYGGKGQFSVGVNGEGMIDNATGVKEHINSILSNIETENSGVSQFSPEEQKLLDDVPKPQEKSIQAALDCLTKMIV